jgi:hypothetical protein
MALKELVTDLGAFYKENPYQAAYKTKAGPVLALKQGFNQRSIPFGDDRPGGGNSNQPFLQQKLPAVNSSPTDTFPDFLLRDPKNAINDRADDLKRITKFLVTPQGGLFITKQELLSLQNPIVPGRPNRATPVSGLYNPLMTLAQVGASGTGLHIEKQGLYPIFDKYEKYEYQYKNLFNFNTTNRLTVLFKRKIGELSTADPTVRKFQPTFGVGNLTGVSADPTTILAYQGGANSFGVGRTVIPFADNRAFSQTTLGIQNQALQTSKEKAKLVNYDYSRYLGVTNRAVDLKYVTVSPQGANLQNYLNNQINGNSNGFDFDPSVYFAKATFPDTNAQKTTAKNVFVLKQTQLIERTPIGFSNSTSLTNITDFRKQVRETYTQNSEKVAQDQQGIIYFDYTSNKVNREQRVGLGNPGKRGKNRQKLTSYDNETVDRINILPPYYSNVVADPDTLTRDLVKFRFEIVDNLNPQNSTFLHFRAFLGAINDNFKSEWDMTKYVGRGEKFYNYTGFSRDISFTFQVHPQSRNEMKSIYQKLNLLAASLAPDYRQGYMKGNLIRLTIGDYIYTVPGFISNLTYTVPQEAAWEIALNSPEGGSDYGLLETPKYFEVNVSFTPIHDFAPQLGTTAQTAFITPQKEGARNPFLSEISGSTNSYTDRKQSYVVAGSELNSETQANLQRFSTPGLSYLNVTEAPVGDTNFTGGAPVPSYQPLGQVGLFAPEPPNETNLTGGAPVGSNPPLVF